MRIHGNLVRWNDDRGFGFIAPAQGTEEIFVHISQFPRDGVRPTPGELLSFETETGADGKTKAVRVMRAGQRATPRRSHGAEHRSSSTTSWLGTLVVVLVLVAIGVYGYSALKGHDSPAPPLQGPAAQAAVAPAEPAPSFSCDGRTMCSQMTSCAEATYFIRHCPDTKMDGNGDGVPCEQQWCDWSDENDG
jgi:cold shock CspA family protein